MTQNFAKTQFDKNFEILTPLDFLNHLESLNLSPSRLSLSSAGLCPVCVVLSMDCLLCSERQAGEEGR